MHRQLLVAVCSWLLPLAAALPAQTLVRDLTPAGASTVGGNPGTAVICNSSFAIDVGNALPHSIAVLFASFAPSAIVLDGCRVLLGLPATNVAAVFTDAAGVARTPFPIPANPALHGFQAFAQCVVLDPNGPLFGEFSLSDGLRLRVGT